MLQDFLIVYAGRLLPTCPPTEPMRIFSCQSEVIDPDTLMIYQLARAGDSA